MEYIASLSYGKDSIAMLEAIKILGLPLDRIIHAEVWATDTIPADLPPMVEFKAKADKLILEKYGIVVEHTCATRGGSGGHTIVVSTPSLPKERVETKIGADFAEVSLTKKARGANETSNLILSPPLEKLTYEKLFYRQYQRGGRQGEIQGFARRTAKYCVSELKQHALDKIRLSSPDRRMVPPAQNGTFTGFQCERGTGAPAASKPPFSESPVSRGANKNIVQYLGIAADEPERIERHTKPNIVLPLVQIGWDEAYCREWCEQNNLLSPIYTTAARGGCWFCHNQGIDQLRLLRSNYPDLWALMLKWDRDSPVSFHADGHTVHDFENRFAAEDQGLVPKDRKFRWKMLNLKGDVISMASTTKKTEEVTATYSGLNVFQKLLAARQMFLAEQIEKSGKNIAIGFKYFELEDIVPKATEIFQRVGLIALCNFTEENATMTVYNTEKPEEWVPFNSPMRTPETNKGVNPVQALGAAHTYLRRYLYMLALDIVEPDEIEPKIRKDADAEAPAPATNSKMPVTQEQRKAIKEEITSPAAQADELQIKALKAALSKLLDIDPEQESFIQEIVVRTESFTKISKEACEQLIVNIGGMIEAYNTVEG